MIRGISDRYIELGTSHIQIYDYLDDGLDGVKGVLDWALENPEEAGLDKETADAVSGVWRERQGLGLVVKKGERFGATIRAVDAGFWKEKGSKKFLEVIEGSADIENSRELLLGRGLAENIGAQPGEAIGIMTIKTNEAGDTVPAVTPFKIKGIVSSGYRELDALWCIIGYEAGEAILSPDLSRSMLLVKTENPYKGADKIAFSLGAWFGPGCGVYTWQRLESSLYRSFASTRQMLLFIMAILVIVAAVNVAQATSMLVIERRRDIAIFKTGGASPLSATGIFIWASFLTGLSGAVAGSALGLFIGSFINQIIKGLETFLGIFSGGIKILDPEYYLETIPIIIDWKMICLIFVFTVLCSVLASWLPARSAGKQKPVEILSRV
jgi:lipoprotein-releasing system permease protein